MGGDAVADLVGAAAARARGAADEPAVTSALPRQQLENERRLAVRPRGEDDSLVIPLHGASRSSETPSPLAGEGGAHRESDGRVRGVFPKSAQLWEPPHPSRYAGPFPLPRGEREIAASGPLPSPPTPANRAASPR